MRDNDDLEFFDENEEEKNDSSKKKFNDDDLEKTHDSESLEEIISHYYDNNEFEKALKYVNILIELYPYNTESWHRKALLLDCLGRYEEALIYFDKAILLNPNDLEILVNKAITFDNSEQYGKAVETFDIVLDIDPKNLEALFNKGLSLERLEKFSEAVECFETVIKSDEFHKDAYYELAICYEYSCWWSPDGPFIDQVSIDQSSINGDWILLFKNIYIPDDAYVIISLDNETDEDNKYVIFDAVKIVAQ